MFKAFSYAIKLSGYVFQLMSLYLITDVLETQELASFFFITSAAAIASSLCDFGFIRYSFRYLNRSTPPSLIIARSLQAIATGSAIAGPMYLCLAYFGAERLDIAILLYPGAIAIQLVNVNRYLLIDKKQYNSTILTEVIQPFVFLFFIAACLTFGYRQLTTVCAAYLCSQICSLLFSIRIAHAQAHWREGWLLALERRHARGSSGLFRSLSRAAPVGLDQILSNVWFQLPVVLSGILSEAHTTAVIGLFTRILNVAKGFVSVSVTINLASFYSRSHTELIVKRASFAAAAASALLLPAIYLIHWSINQFHHIFSDAPIISLVDELSESAGALTLIFSGIFLYQQISFALLGINLRKQRALASFIGIIAFGFSSVVLVVAMHYQSASPYLWSLTASLTASITFMLAILFRRPAHA
ncbi:hypothetical protein [Rhodoligotrophos ferricapiens]|uniref:hypothetical protein n=1 Tax=Rhodoligotrophos ferricapiens TaxID=3069264 RepID=UPI00315C610E